LEIIDAWLRMLRLSDRSHEIETLAPMIEREILFRALQGPLGDVLREMERPGGRLVQIRLAMQWIRITTRALPGGGLGAHGRHERSFLLSPLPRRDVDDADPIPEASSPAQGERLAVPP
jgi:hypothetical protein